MQHQLFSVPADDPLRKVRDGLLSDASAPNTRKAYESDVRHYSAWCEASGRLAGSADSVELYVTHLFELGRKPSTISRRLAALSGCLDKGLLAGAKKLVCGIRRRVHSRVNSKAALGASDLRKIVKCGSVSKRDCAVVALGFCCGLRRSEISALDLQDVVIRGLKVVVNVRRSKTDGVGKGREVLAAHVRGVDLRMVLAAWLGERGRDPGPFFLRAGVGRPGPTRRLGTNTVNSLVKRCCSEVGLDGSKYGAHSLRAGLVTSAISSGAHPFDVMKVTGHRAVQTVYRYYRPEGTSRLKVRV